MKSYECKSLVISVGNTITTPIPRTKHGLSHHSQECYTKLFSPEIERQLMFIRYILVSMEFNILQYSFQ
jgi:hypothetical protein